MLADLSSSLHFMSSIGNLVHYITFRTIAACLTALFITLRLGPHFIKLLHKYQASQPIRADGPSEHLTTKAGTPTMGGALLIFATLLSTLLWADLENGFVWATLLVFVGFGFIGGIDDFMKLRFKNTKGLSARMRLICEFIIATIAILIIESLTPISMRNSLALPFLKNALLYLGMFFILWGILFTSGFANAVNLTDGLDGLATVPSIMCAVVLGIFAYVGGNHLFADYLGIPFITGSSELAIICASLIGACLGFLWFNAPPAEIFMGDTGSLALGGALATMALAIKTEFALCVAGGLFLVEMFSVIIQVGWFKYCGRRIFLMAPIHHHFEKKGWAETKIVIRFWIISFILALCALATLKIR